MSELNFYDLTYEGPVVQAILDTAQKLRTDGYIFMGAGTPSTVPGTPTERVWYLCGPGTYANFGTSVTVPEGSVMVVQYASGWTTTVIEIASAGGGTFATGEAVGDMSIFDDVSDIVNLTPAQRAETMPNGEAVSDSMRNTMITRTFGITDCDIRRTTNNATETTSPSRLRCVLQVPKGASISASTTNAGGLALGIWSTQTEAIVSANTNILQPSAASWSASQSLVTNQAGWMCVSLRKSNNTVITSTEILALIEAATIVVTYDVVVPNSAQQSTSESGVRELYIGKLYQGATSASGKNVTTTKDCRVSMEDVLSIPYSDVKLKCHFPSGIYLLARFGLAADNLNQYLYFYKDGDEVTAPSGCDFYRLTFMRYNSFNVNSTLTGETSKYPLLVAEVEAMMADGSLRLTYEDKDTDTVVQRNHDAERLAKSFLHLGTDGQIRSLKDYPILAHTSDTHGDVTRTQNFFEYAKFIGANYAINTGDIMAVNTSNGGNYFFDTEAKYDIPTFFAIGNHDTKGITSDVVATQYNTFVKPLVDRWGYTANNKPYYYYDDTTYKLRFIVMNLYDAGQPATGAYTCTITIAQINWLIATLASTPADYGVLLLYHNPENYVVNSDTKFMQSGYTSSESYNTWLMHSGMSYIDSKRPIETIVNGFIRREAVSGGYKNANDNTVYTYSHDFSADGLTTQVFIAHINGHEHADTIGYYKGYDGNTAGNSRQVVLNVPQTQALYIDSTSGLLANLEDMPRGGVGATQDNFNIYVIDKADKEIHIIKVGSTMAYQTKVRDYTTITFE